MTTGLPALAVTLLALAVIALAVWLIAEVLARHASRREREPHVFSDEGALDPSSRSSKRSSKT